MTQVGHADDAMIVEGGTSQIAQQASLAGLPYIPDPAALDHVRAALGRTVSGAAPVAGLAALAYGDRVIEARHKTAVGDWNQSERPRRASVLMHLREQAARQAARVGCGLVGPEQVYVVAVPDIVGDPAATETRHRPWDALPGADEDIVEIIYETPARPLMLEAVQ